MNDQQVLEAIKNMNPHDKEMFLLTHRVGKLEIADTSSKSKVNEIRVEQNRLNLLMGQFADLNTKLDDQARLIFNLTRRINDLEAIQTAEIEEEPKKSWLDKLFNK